MKLHNDHSTLAIAGALPVTRGDVAMFARDPVACMSQLYTDHGEVSALVDDAMRLHFVFGPHYTKQVLADEARFHSHFFALRGGRKSSQRRLTSGLLSMNGDEHRRNRRMVMGPFQKKAIANYHDTIVSLTQDLIDDWQPGDTINVAKEMVQFMLRLTSSILFGLDEPEFAHHVGMKIERWVSLNHEIGPAAFVPDRSLVDRYDELLLAADELEEALRELLHRKRTGKMGFDVLSLLIHAHDDAGGISDDQLMGHLALLFGAAHLTSAHTLTWTFFLLGQHPEVADLLFREVQESNGGSPPALDQVDTLRTLDCVLKESMRILPASSYSQRIAAETVDLGPFRLEPGAIVIFSQLITHHLDSLYPQADRFLPERWESITPSPYAYMPFGAGPRMCIGAALGMMQIKLAVSTILCRWKLQAIPRSTVNARVLSTMLFPDGAVRMEVQPADGIHLAHPVIGNIHNLLQLPDAMEVAARRAA